MDSISDSKVAAGDDDDDQTVSGHMIQAVFSMLWSTVVIEMWKRRSTLLAYRWGTMQLAERFSEPRPAYHGALGVNPVTGRVEPLFPAWQRELRMALVSVPAVGLFLGRPLEGASEQQYSVTLPGRPLGGASEQQYSVKLPGRPLEGASEQQYSVKLVGRPIEGASEQ